jgi:DNA repair protein RadC
LLDDAAEVLVYHNHPSGELEPSRDDLALTRRLVQAGETVGVPLVDHIVVAGPSWRSLRRSNPELFVMSW